MGLCCFHPQKHRQRITAHEAGRPISPFLDTNILTACDLNSAFAAHFAATAQGYIKPKTTATLGYLGQLMLQTQRFAKQEFLEACDADTQDDPAQKDSATTGPTPAETS
jgi:hypothetical protein